MTSDEQIRLAERTKLIFEDEILQGALAEIKSAIIAQWSDLGVENKVQADELKRLLWAAQQFESIFTVTIAGAAVARNELLNDSTMKIRAEAAKRRIYG